MACNVSIRQALVVPTRGVLRMECVPSLPAVREVTIRDEDDEVHIAELVGLTTREGSEKNESLERRLGRSFGELEDTRPLTQSFRGGPARPVVESDHERRFSQRARATDSGQPDLGACDEPLPDVVAAVDLVELARVGREDHLDGVAGSSVRLAPAPPRDGRDDISNLLDLFAF